MAGVKWHKNANKDLIHIYSYISKDSIHYSVKTVNDIIKLVDTLKLLPYIGRKIPEYDEYSKRELIYKSYRIMYKVDSGTIYIYRIWHSSRKVSKDLIS